MAEIFPFRAFRYNAKRVEPAKVLTQPYDKITPAMAEKYAAASPYNLIPVEKGKSLPDDAAGNNVYTRAAKALEDWIWEGVIVRDETPSLYAYFQEYTVPRTSDRRTRKGFIAVGRVETMRPTSYSGTNRRFPVPKRTGWNYCVTRKHIPGSYS